MEDLSREIFSNPAFGTRRPVGALITEIRDYIVGFLARHPHHDVTMRSNCLLVERLVGGNAPALYDRHLTYLAAKYAFYLGFRSDSETALAEIVRGTDIDTSCMEMDGSTGHLIVNYHYGRYVEAAMRVIQLFASKGRQVTIVLRPPTTDQVEVYYRSFSALCTLVGADPVLTSFNEISRYLSTPNRVLFISPDQVDFARPKHNRVYNCGGGYQMRISKSLNLICERTGCLTHFITRLGVDDGPIRIVTAEGDATQQLLERGLMPDLIRDPAQWDRIKYADRILSQPSTHF